MLSPGYFPKHVVRELVVGLRLDIFPATLLWDGRSLELVANLAGVANLTIGVESTLVCLNGIPFEGIGWILESGSQPVQTRVLA